MATGRVCVLIADLPVVASALRETMPLDHVEVLEAHTFDEATQLAERRHPRICIIGYHFDEMRPYRLVQHVRGMDWASGADILVIRALPLRQPASEEEALRKAYMSIGADDYLTLYSDADHRQQLDPLRQAVQRRIGRL